jgi:hypothetical protein
MPDQAELNREILKPAERAERLRLAVNSGAKLRLERPIDRFDLPVIQSGGRRFGLHLALLNMTKDESSGRQRSATASRVTDDAMVMHALVQAQTA